MQGLLHEDEIRRADQFHFDRDRRRYVATRGTLRKILAPFLECDPRTIFFDYSSAGKPSIAGSPLHFNVSHSHELAIFAVSERRIGIDVEHVCSRNSYAGIARRYFSPEEQSLLSSVPPEERQRWFFRIWTLKEAYLKATGEGLAGLERVETAWDDQHIPRFHRKERPEEAKRWTIWQFDLDTEYLGACLVENQ